MRINLKNGLDNHPTLVTSINSSANFVIVRRNGLQENTDMQLNSVYHDICKGDEIDITIYKNGTTRRVAHATLHCTDITERQFNDKLKEAHKELDVKFYVLHFFIVEKTANVSFGHSFDIKWTDKIIDENNYEDGYNSQLAKLKDNFSLENIGLNIQTVKVVLDAKQPTLYEYGMLEAFQDRYNYLEQKAIEDGYRVMKADIDRNGTLNLANKKKQIEQYMNVHPYWLYGKGQLKAIEETLNPVKDWYIEIRKADGHFEPEESRDTFNGTENEAIEYAHEWLKEALSLDTYQKYVVVTEMKDGEAIDYTAYQGDFDLRPTKQEQAMIQHETQEQVVSSASYPIIKLDYIHSGEAWLNISCQEEQCMLETWGYVNGDRYYLIKTENTSIVLLDRFEKIQIDCHYERERPLFSQITFDIVSHTDTSMSITMPEFPVGHVLLEYGEGVKIVDPEKEHTAMQEIPSTHTKLIVEYCSDHTLLLSHEDATVASMQVFVNGRFVGRNDEIGAIETEELQALDVIDIHLYINDNGHDLLRTVSFMWVNHKEARMINRDHPLVRLYQQGAIEVRYNYVLLEGNGLFISSITPIDTNDYKIVFYAKKTNCQYVTWGNMQKLPDCLSYE